MKTPDRIYRMKNNFIFSHGRKFNDRCPDNRRNTHNQRVFHRRYERVMPPITHAEIVEPRRERPGIVEKPWKNPAISASFGFKFFCVFSPSGSISATTSRIAVRYRPTPGASRFEEVSVTSSESCRRLQQSGWCQKSAGKQAYGSCCRAPSGTASS
mgnify:CR=1 FL=1